MKKLLLAVSLAAGLAACATTGGVDKPAVDNFVAEVQAYAQQACGLLPVASSVIEVAGALAGAPGVGVAVSTVGGAICNGFVTRQASVGGIVTVNVNTPKGIVKVKATRVKR
jgi:NAD/NADP transhydrogenase beta subunit